MAIERREQVFISSTYLDLKEERQEVIQTLLEADCIPAGMELFPASNDDRWTLIQRVIDDCDYYVLVMGGRYGSVDSETELSYTEMEFDYADEKKKPIMVFLHSNPGLIPAEKSERSEKLTEKLEAFREKASARMAKYYDSPASLGGQVAKSLIQTRKTHPAEGWIRASNALTPEIEQELAELRARVAELTTKDALDKATGAPSVALEHLEQGDDSYNMVTILTYSSTDDVKNGYMHRSEWGTVNLRLSATWNELFAAVAPDLMDESSEALMKGALDQFALSHAREKVPFSFSPKGIDGDPVEIGRVHAATINSQTFNDVKIQLFALQLIEQSERKRPVSDSNTYWTLTARGRDALMTSFARRRPGLTADSAASTAPPSTDTEEAQGS